jgi:hypothetical protein
MTMTTWPVTLTVNLVSKIQCYRLLRHLKENYGVDVFSFHTFKSSVHLSFSSQLSLNVFLANEPSQKMLNCRASKDFFN